MHPCRSFARIVVLLIALAGAVVFASAGHARAQEEVTVDVGDFWFCDASFEEGTCETAISAGDTVVWDFSSSINSHTATDCGGSCDAPSASQVFDSGTVGPGGSYSFTFDDPGSYPYLCSIHPTLMFGRIVVQAPEPSPTPDDGGPSATATAGGSDDGGLPPAGGGPASGATASWWPTLVVLAGGGALLALLGATGYRRTR